MSWPSETSATTTPPFSGISTFSRRHRAAHVRHDPSIPTSFWDGVQTPPPEHPKHPTPPPFVHCQPTNTTFPPQWLLLRSNFWCDWMPSRHNMTLLWHFHYRLGEQPTHWSTDFPGATIPPISKHLSIPSPLDLLSHPLIYYLTPFPSQKTPSSKHSSPLLDPSDL